MIDLEQLYQQVETLIEQRVGVEGTPFVCGKFEGLGWLYYHYKCSTYEGPYPRISLKQQKNAIHFYIMLWIDGVPVLERYIEVFGKSAVGKGCLRIKKWEDKHINAVLELIDLAIEKTKNSKATK